MKLTNGKVFTSKLVGTGPSSYEKNFYRAGVPQNLRNTGVTELKLDLPFAKTDLTVQHNDDEVRKMAMNLLSRGGGEQATDVTHTPALPLANSSKVL